MVDLGLVSSSARQDSRRHQVFGCGIIFFFECSLVMEFEFEEAYFLPIYDVMCTYPNKLGFNHGCRWADT